MNDLKSNQDKSCQQKRKRRTRNDQDGRNYTCTCGKSYLSYPALYTHIKTKHGGNTSYGSYGKMPLKDDQLDSNGRQESEEEIDRIDDSNNLENLKKYLTKFFPFTQKDKDLEKKLKEASKQDEDYLKSIKQYWDKRKKQQQPHENQTYCTPIDYVMGRFLLEVESDVSKSCQKYLRDFMINLKNSLNEFKSQNYCNSNSASQIPALMNDLFTEKFQKMDQQHLYIKHPTILCKTIYHFCRWLFHQHYTNLSLKFNSIA